jgi:hypothetical protein
MYPNPQDVLPLSPRPEVEQYRRRAAELAKVCLSGKPGALLEWASSWLAELARGSDEVQLVSGRERERLAGEIAEFAHTQLTRAGCAVSEAQFIVARAHGFKNWPGFVRHLEELGVEGSEVATFERAADAVIRGDLPTVKQLLSRHDTLVAARSTREHRGTLLHYVAANGVENYRQKTPPNIVDIARRLLDAGAAVDAEADVYGGGATTLGLVVTSAHPRQMKVQDALADLLLDRGARLEPGFVRSCLANGCPEAAEHLLRRGADLREADLTLEEAAGLGRVDLVAARWPTSDAGQRTSALMMAAWYGRIDVIRLLLDRGLDPNVRHAKDGDTALHIAAYNGNSDLVRLLLERGAQVNVTDDVYGTPPLVWSLHAWLVEDKGDAGAHRDVLRALVDRGATVKSEWIDDPRLREDEALWAALTKS